MKNSLYLILILTTINVEAQNSTIKPAFQINYNYNNYSCPTKDKPQSKLWFMQNFWWAILPGEEGPSLWQRESGGWCEHKEVNSSLKGIPAQVDVWYEKETVTAIGVSDSSLCVFNLNLQNPKNPNGPWLAKVLSYLDLPFKSNKIETATIVKDGSGVWWVAADINSSIFIWSSYDSKNWSKPFLIGEDIDDDDISSIAVLDDRVIALWSNQKEDAIYSREHINRKALDDWSEIIVVESGGNTADDHINTAVSPDGMLWVVTKNEVDDIGYPNLVLRVRNKNGDWGNYPYLVKTQYTEPSRPAIFSLLNSNIILAGHTLYHKDSKQGNQIVFGSIDINSTDILIKEQVVIDPDFISHKVQINDITGPKEPFPENAPWIILASDNKGRIYEVDLSKFFNKN